MDSTELLPMTLALAVPLWIEQVRSWSIEHTEARRSACADAVAHHGDLILFRSSRQGETAENFNRLAEGIAICAFAPGGIDIFGMHFEASP